MDTRDLGHDDDVYSVHMEEKRERDELKVFYKLRSLLKTLHDISRIKFSLKKTFR